MKVFDQLSPGDLQCGHHASHLKRNKGSFSKHENNKLELLFIEKF